MTTYNNMAFAAEAAVTDSKATGQQYNVIKVGAVFIVVAEADMGAVFTKEIHSVVYRAAFKKQA